MFLPLLPCYSLDYLGWQLLDQPFMYLCICVYMTYVCIMYVCMNLCVSICNVCVSVYICMSVSLYAYLHVDLYGCMYYVCPLYITEYRQTRQGCQSCLWSGEQGKLIFPCPWSRLRIMSRETSSTVPSRTSLLILYTQAIFSAYSRDPSRFSRWCPCIYTAIRHRVSPEFTGSRNCVPTAFIAESPSA